MIRKNLLEVSDPRYQETENAFLDFLKAAFGVFFFIYCTIFPLLLFSLKRTFPELYLKDRLRIFIASISIIFSIAARVIFIWAWRTETLHKILIESYEQDTWLYPLASFTFEFCAVICPLGSMIFSMIYLMDKEKE